MFTKLDLDRIIMDYKLELRSKSKPGDNLWDIIENDVAHSDVLEDGTDENFVIAINIGSFGPKRINIEVSAVDDCGEWELVKPRLVCGFNSMDL